MGQIILASGEAVNSTGPVSGSAQSTSLIDTGNYQITFIATDVFADTFRVGIEDTPDGTNWSPIAVFCVTPQSDTNLTYQGYQKPGLKVGAGAEARLVVYDITGASPTAKVTALISWAV